MEDRREENVPDKQAGRTEMLIWVVCAWFPLLSRIWTHYSQPSAPMTRWVDAVELIGKSHQSVIENKGK